MGGVQRCNPLAALNQHRVCRVDLDFARGDNLVIRIHVEPGRQVQLVVVLRLGRAERPNRQALHLNLHLTLGVEDLDVCGERCGRCLCDGSRLGHVGVNSQGVVVVVLDVANRQVEAHRVDIQGEKRSPNGVVAR